MRFYHPEIDGLRFVAFAAVFAHHALPHPPLTPSRGSRPRSPGGSPRRRGPRPGHLVDHLDSPGDRARGPLFRGAGDNPPPRRRVVSVAGAAVSQAQRALLPRRLAARRVTIPRCGATASPALLPRRSGPDHVARVGALFRDSSTRGSRHRRARPAHRVSDDLICPTSVLVLNVIVGRCNAVGAAQRAPSSST